MSKKLPSIQECRCLLSIACAPMQKYVDHAIASETYEEWELASSLWSMAAKRAEELSDGYKEDANRCRIKAMHDISKKSIMDKPTDPAFRVFNELKK